MSFEVPLEAIDYIRQVFKEANEEVTRIISNIPNTYEVTLDQDLIRVLGRIHPKPKSLANSLIDIQTHFIGGGAHLYRSEVADIGIIVTFYRGSAIIRRKLAFLQSKRLYAAEDDSFRSPESASDVSLGSLDYVIAERKFTFDKDSKYDQIVAGGKQVRIINDYQQRNIIPVFYLLYHPAEVPYYTSTQSVQKATINCKVGTRVVRSQEMHTCLDFLSEYQRPSFGFLEARLGSPYVDHNKNGWRLEYFMADLVISCEEGYSTENPHDPILERASDIYRRRGPISTAIAINIRVEG